MVLRFQRLLYYHVELESSSQLPLDSPGSVCHLTRLTCRLTRAITRSGSDRRGPER